MLAALSIGSALLLYVGASSAETPAAAAASEAADSVSPARVRLISQEQYANTLAYVFGPDVKVAAHFAPFRRTDGLLEVGASSAGITLGQMQEFQRTAGAMAEQVVNPEHRNFLIPCAPRHEDRADKRCASEFLSAVGRLLYRRPLTKAESIQLATSAGESADRLKDFYAGLSVTLEGLLVSPDMLFIIDRSEPDPDEPSHATSGWLFARQPPELLFVEFGAGRRAPENGLSAVTLAKPAVVCQSRRLRAREPAA